MNRMLDNDIDLCIKKIELSKTQNEKKFFSEILRKATEEIALSGDLMMSENDNDYGIYILREVYDEFRTGVASIKPECPEVFADGISELLSVRLESIGLHNDITIGEWLQNIDYKGINYNANYDLQ